MTFSSGSIAEKHYEAAREELVTRVKLRDHSLLAFLGFSGVVFGYVLGGAGGAPKDWNVALVVPYVGLGATILVSQHNAVIGALIRFIAYDLEPFMREHGCNVPEFGNSNTFRKHSMWSNRMRTVGHLIVLSVPAILALASNWRHAIQSPFPFGPIWWFGALALIVSFCLTWYVHNRRKEVYDHTPWGDWSYARQASFPPS